MIRIRSIFLSITFLLFAEAADAQLSADDWTLVARIVQAVNISQGSSTRVDVYKNKWNNKMVVDVDDYFYPEVMLSNRTNYKYMYKNISVFTGGAMCYFNLPTSVRTRTTNPKSSNVRQDPRQRQNVLQRRR